MTAPSDQRERDAAIRERARNVLLDAGAGTGKTSTLVDRIIALVAPDDDHTAPMSLDRIAAVTFTRRAAGELRLRLRERLLAALASPGVASGGAWRRAQRLQRALGQLDAAHVGTIHSFADRLLRLHPVEANLSPSYAIADDDSALIAATHEELLHMAEAGTLAAAFVGMPLAERALEAEQTFRDALRAGLRAEAEDFGFHLRAGLDTMFAAFVRHRDVPPHDPPPRAFDRDALARAALELRQLVAPCTGTSVGARWLRDLSTTVERVRAEADPFASYAELHDAASGLKGVTKTETFEGDAAAWHAWKLLTEGKSNKVSRLVPLRDDLLAPFQRLLATRLVRTFPVVVALYERVKARHEAVDTVDLLLKLRDLLQSDKQARATYQIKFDHIFVDEFQDTDPLQAEVLLFLCENGANAARAADVELAPGKLTIVGDPKQSIYRFRRADIGMYEHVRAKVASGPHVSARLTANFRSTPPLIEWFNDRFEALLGPAPTDGSSLFSTDTGEVAYQPLARGRTDGRSISIHVVPFASDEEKTSADAYRALEAEVLARYLRWLVERSDVEILDPVTRRRRGVRYGDIAVLAFATTSLPLLFPELDGVGVPHAARGGKLFLSDRLHRQFLLGLAAIADRDDGVAQAALHRPPFFALDVADVASKSAAYEGAREIIQSLRAKRDKRSPGDTARALLEETAFGRSIAVGPNGAQRLERLRELCFALDDVAAREALDFDGATARLRAWAIDPVPLDPPHPTGEEVVQILTVHQAKGLEFPVVILWDGRAGIDAPPEHRPWHVAPDGRAWQLTLDKLAWEEPQGAAVKATEKRYCDAERKRLIYVAATRARDLLVVPKAGVPGQKHIAGMLLGGDHDPLALEQQVYRRSSVPQWAASISTPGVRDLTPADAETVDVAAAFGAALAASATARLVSIGVTDAVHATPTAAEGPRPRRLSRFGPVFGDTVHRAIGHALRSPAVDVDTAVRRAALLTGLDVHVVEAAADVARALEALAPLGISPSHGADVEAIRLEYPVVGPRDASMLVGYVDLVAARPLGPEGELVVLDFKTDAWDGTTSVSLAFPAYIAQLGAYVDLLRDAGLVGQRRVRAGLLFTQLGRIEWVLS